MSHPDAPQHPPHAEAGVWRELELLLDDLEVDARRPQDVESFHAALLARLAAGVAARSGAVWLRQSGRLRLVSETNEHSRGVADRGEHELLLAAAIAKGRTVVVSPRTELAEGARNTSDDYRAIGIVALSTWLPAGWGPPRQTSPLGEKGDAVAVVELALPAGRSPSSYRGAREVVETACQAAAEFHARAELVRLQQERRERDALIEFSRAIAEPLDLQATAFAIVNEGRRLLGCDRLSLLVARGSRLRLEAVSGVDRVERRGQAARQLTTIAREALKLAEPIYYADGQIDALPQVADAAHRYVDQSHARVLAVVPMELGTGEEDFSRRVVGVLVAEAFTGTDHLSAGLVSEVARLAAPALATAQAWHDLPLGWALKRLTWLRRPQALLRAAFAAAIVAAGVAALMLVQSPLRIDVRGELLPVVRQDIFAPREAIVESLAVAHGTEVESGETLMTLRDPDLALEIARVAGETTTAQRQLEAIRATRTTAGGQRVDPVERYRLSAQEEELKARLANLAREAELFTRQRESLTVVSPIAGQVITWEVDQRLAGRPVERGQVLLSVANTAGEWQLELQIPDDQMDAIRHAAADGTPLEVEYRLGSDTSQLHRATITDIAQRADIVQLPSGEETRSVVAHARPVSEMTAELREAALRPGGSVRARIVCGDHPVGYVWLRDAWRALRNWWEF